MWFNETNITDNRKDEPKLYCHVCGKPIEDCNYEIVNGWETHTECLKEQE
jgi:hypothetical protein